MGTDPKRRLSRGQIGLIHRAAQEVGLIGDQGDHRYRMLLLRFTDRRSRAIRSSTQLDWRQFEEFMAICEGLGFRQPGKSTTYWRTKSAYRRSRSGDGCCSQAAQFAICALARDLGWDQRQLAGMVRRMSEHKVEHYSRLTPRQAYNLIEALKAMLMRVRSRHYTDLKDIQKDMEATHGEEQTD